MSVSLPICMAQEKESGNPFFIELYVIELRTGVLRLAACDENVIYNGMEYIAVPFQRGDVKRSKDNITDSVEITLGDCSYELLSFVMNGFDFRGCNATVFKIMYPDSLKDPSVAKWVFSGFIDEPSFTGGSFSCQIVARMPEINCPNRNFRLACNSEFGDAECGMSLSTETLSVKSVNGCTIKLSQSYPSNYWKDGVITITGESRTITSSNNDSVTVNVGFAQLNLNGSSATLRRGCDKTVARCKQYNNMQHYGGFPAIPFESTYR